MRTVFLLIFLLSAHPLQAEELERFPVQHGAFLIDWRDDFSPQNKQRLQLWLAHMGRAIARLHGDWPRPQIRIAFKKYSSDSPVPFGRILRNRPEGILFYVDPSKPLQAFIADWTAYHEFAHLFIPYPGPADSWFSEGLASYYQNILQVRAGVLSDEEALQRFDAAFLRGANDNEHADLSLAELSKRMIERRAFMRVYWSGALYFMEVDLALRGLEPPQMLDSVLREFNACCQRDGVEMPARQIAAELDRIAGTKLITGLFDRYAQSRAMPDWQLPLEQARTSGLLSPLAIEEDLIGR